MVLGVAEQIETLARRYALREAQTVSTMLFQSAAQMSLPEWVALAKENVERIEKIEQGSAPPVFSYVEQAFTGEDLTVEWCLDGLIPRGTATMLTAEEGVGKSTVLRQIALAAGAGFQPFLPWAEKYDPVRTLLIDCEVTENQFKRSLRALWGYGNRYGSIPPQTVAWESQQGGINLSEPFWQGWLHRRVRDHKADLVVIGPVYRFTDADLNTEEGVRTWQRAFEPLLADGVSVVTEHHAPNGAPGAVRALRPIGSSAMRRWFAQGVALRNRKCDVHEELFCATCTRTATVEAWRGTREEEARWPRYLRGETGHVWWVADEMREVMGSEPI
jgi:replicative DNA helicase